MRVYGAMNDVGLGHVVWRVSSWGFRQMGFVWVARVRTKGQSLQIKGQSFAETKIAVADSIRVPVTSVLAGHVLLGGTCVASMYCY